MTDEFTVRHRREKPDAVVSKPIVLRELQGAVERAAQPLLQRHEIDALRGARVDLAAAPRPGNIRELRSAIRRTPDKGGRQAG